jgi:hypothetical protein
MTEMVHAITVIIERIISQIHSPIIVIFNPMSETPAAYGTTRERGPTVSSWHAKSDSTGPSVRPDRSPREFTLSSSRCWQECYRRISTSWSKRFRRETHRRQQLRWETQKARGSTLGPAQQLPAIAAFLDLGPDIFAEGAKALTHHPAAYLRGKPNVFLA